MIISIQAVFRLNECENSTLNVKDRIDFSTKFKRVSALYFQANFKFLHNKRRYLESFKSDLAAERKRSEEAKVQLIKTTYDKVKYKKIVKRLRQF